MGLNEIKDYMKKTRRIGNNKKATTVINTSLKSYTVRSNDVEENLLTKE